MITSDDVKLAFKQLHPDYVDISLCTRSRKMHLDRGVGEEIILASRPRRAMRARNSKSDACIQDGKSPSRGFTKKQDKMLLHDLFSSKSYADFAVMFRKSYDVINAHVREIFGIPKCEIHAHFNQDCSDCRKKVLAWRVRGARIIAGKKYLVYTHAPVSPSVIEGSKNVYFNTYNLQVCVDKCANALKEMQNHFNFPVEIMNGAAKLLECYYSKYTLTGLATSVAVSAAILIEYERAGMAMQTKGLVTSLAEYIGKDPRQIRQAYSMITRRMNMKVAPSTFVDMFEASPLKAKFSTAELSAINAYLRAMDDHPTITSGKSMHCSIASAIYAALNRIGIKITKATVARWCGVDPSIINERLANMKQLEDRISDEELIEGMSRAGGFPSSSEKDRFVQFERLRDSNGDYHRSVSSEGIFEWKGINYSLGKIHAGKKVTIHVVDNELMIRDSTGNLLKTVTIRQKKPSKNAVRLQSRELLGYTRVIELNKDKKPEPYTKEQDQAIIAELFSTKQYEDFAIAFDKSYLNIISHVKNRFGLPRCKDHVKYSKDCQECFKSLQAWRLNAEKIIASCVYNIPKPYQQ